MHFVQSVCQFRELWEVRDKFRTMCFVYRVSGEKQGIRVIQEIIKEKPGNLLVFVSSIT